MSLPLAKNRELVLQILYSCHFLDHLQDQDPAFFMSQLKTTRKNVLAAFQTVEEILKQKQNLDLQIAQHSTSYDLSRIQSVELNVLRLCLYEMLNSESIPKEVLISEGIRLAKKFSTSQSISFINGVLEHLYKNNASVNYTA